MKKRVICLLLSFLILLSLLPFGAVKVSAASNMTTSEKAIEVLKTLEGFIPKPIYDHGQYSVGYGSGCNKNDYPNGITKEQADALLRVHLGKMEKNVNYFLDRYSLSLKQHQFDALMLFTYNVGAGWVNSNGEFRQAVIGGATGSEFLYAITQWSNASSQLQMNLIKRRLAEANMYLNGEYSSSKPSGYSYVLFDNNGGVNSVGVQGYDVNKPTCIRPVPVRTGYRFVGWYTAETGGSWVTHVNSSTAESMVIARWQEGNGDMSNGIPASYKRTASNLATLDVYEQPNGAKVVRSLTTEAIVQIVADYVDASGTKWGKLDKGGWVNLGNPVFGIVTTHETHEPVTVKVTNSYVNVRSGPNTTYQQVGTLKQGAQVDIVETRLVGKDKWGRFKDGWISLMYTDYEQALEDKESADTPTTVIATGTVYNCDSLRIRAGAGTNYPVMGSLAAGSRVEITQKKQGSGMVWGRIPSGWISLTYVKLDAADSAAPSQPGQDQNTATSVNMTVTVTNSYINVRSGPNTTYAKVGTVHYGQQLKLTETRKMGNDMWGKFDSGWVSLMYTNYAAVAAGSGSSSTPEAAPPAQDNTGTAVNMTVTVTNSYINVRSGPNTTYAKVGTVKHGQQLKLTETRKMGNDMWGKFESGWVSLMYTNYAALAGGSNGSSTPETGNSNTGSGVMGTVTTQYPLNIRTGAGTKNVQIGTYSNGTRITILEHTTVDGKLWGKTDRGWVCLDYVKLDTPLIGSQPETQPSVPETQPPATETQPTVPETQPTVPGNEVELNGTSSNTGTVTSYSNLNIRSAPGTFNPQVGSYPRGTRVTILERKTINGTEVWGRTDKGWISLMYVKMDPTEGNSFKGIVNADGLNIRSGPGVHNKSVGSYKTGDQVEITEISYIVDVPWGKTDKGWICLYYVNEI